MDNQTYAPNQIAVLYSSPRGTLDEGSISGIAYGPKPVRHKELSIHGYTLTSCRRGKASFDTCVEYNDVVRMLTRAVDRQEILYFWLIESIEQNAVGKFKSTFYTGYMSEFSLTSLTDPSGVEKTHVSIGYELSSTYGPEGYATLNEEQKKKVMKMLGENSQQTTVNVKNESTDLLGARAVRKKLSDVAVSDVVAALRMKRNSSAYDVKKGFEKGLYTIIADIDVVVARVFVNGLLDTGIKCVDRGVGAINKEGDDIWNIDRPFFFKRDIVIHDTNERMCYLAETIVHEFSKSLSNTLHFDILDLSVEVIKVDPTYETPMYGERHILKKRVDQRPINPSYEATRAEASNINLYAPNHYVLRFQGIAKVPNNYSHLVSETKF